jgi:hypothetical protein
MNITPKKEIRSKKRSVHGIMAALAAALSTLAFASALSAPAGALGSRVTAQSPGATPNAASASDVAPLNQANIVVTDLSTNQASVFSSKSVSPCGSSFGQNQESVCLTLGGAGGLTLSVGSPLQAGQTYSDVMGSATVTVNGASCGEFSQSGPASVFDVQLDQYHPASGPVPYDAFGAQFDCTNPAYDISGTLAYNIVPTDPQDGYYVFGQQGEITGFGNDSYLAYLDGAQYYNLNAPIVGMAPTPDGGGYWMVGSDGGVFASGDAGFYGSTGNLQLNQPVVGMAATPDGKGYWFVASDGGIFAYGDAGFYGSTGSIVLNQPIVGMAAAPDGNGYWFVASDGGVFNYGSAGFAGSLGGTGVDDAAGISLGM